MTTEKPRHRQYQPMCPCGSRGTLWIGSVPSCEECVEKDRRGKHGLRKWNAFHLQQRLENGEAVDLSDVQIEHVLRYREDGE